jgi:hypothetical protein
MGLLDDAIREHLELKRLRGADPGDVAREEHDALGPLRREGESERSGRTDDELPVPSGADGSLSSTLDSAARSSTAGQETVEINIDAEFDAAADLGAGHVRAADVAYPTHAQVGAEESLEWEVPKDHLDEREGSAGSEDDLDPPPDVDEKGTQVDDVLEETPDFLRDTPEQERLWFEQRPPRDFDFNE